MNLNQSSSMQQRYQTRNLHISLVWSIGAWIIRGLSSGPILLSWAIGAMVIGSTPLAISQISLPLSITPNAGGTAKHTLVTLEYTFGEPVAELVTANSLYVNQGFQQSHFENIEITTPVLHFDHFDVDVYPNPFSDHITLSVQNLPAKLQIRIRDLMGRLVSVQTFDQQKLIIPTHTLLPGSYLIEFVELGHNSRQILKLVKI